MSARAARVRAQAKINLGLRVFAREADGFHRIETVFARIGLADDVWVTGTDGGRSLDCAGAALGPPERNLAWRAAVAYHEAAGWPAGFSIEIHKRIPVGAGLGGGSADAGAVLRALDALAPRALGEPRLLEIAATLGADVPFLTSSAAMAFGAGRGDRLAPIPTLPERSVLVVDPGFAVSTVEAYLWLDEARGRGVRLPTPLGNRRFTDWGSLAPFTANDFERVIAARHGQVKEIVNLLRRTGAAIAGLSGSGSAVYGIFDLESDLDAAVKELRWPATATKSATGVAPVEIVEARA